MRTSLLVAALACGGCITVKAVNIGTKTSLERQLIGELEPLTEDEVLASSVRAQGQVGLGSLDDAQAAAIAARRRQLFNKDEVEEAKALGCLGEGRGAELALRSCEGKPEPGLQGRLDTLVTQENEDRAAIIDWAVAADSNLTAAERPEVLRVYRRLLLERAKPGEWVEGDDGTWAKR